MGKTTLCSLLHNARFIGIDDGGRKLLKPDGTPLQYVENPETGVGPRTFDEVRDVLQTPEIFDNDETVVLDTLTEAQGWSVNSVLENVPLEGGGKARNLEHYGWGKGYRHVYDMMQLIRADLDALVYRGKNVVLITQSANISVTNTGGENYVVESPDLLARNNASVLDSFVSWCDYVLRIAPDIAKVTDGKIAGSMTRAIYVQPELHYIAKNRDIPPQYPKIAFSTPQDDSVWRFIFDHAWEQM